MPTRSIGGFTGWRNLTGAEQTIRQTEPSAIAGLAQVVVANPPCPYTAEYAGAAWSCGVPWPNSLLVPQGLNNLGQWVGYVAQCPPNDTGNDAIIWKPGEGLSKLPVPPLTISSQALGINDLGTIVGNRAGTTNGMSHVEWACVWFSDGSFVEIPPVGTGVYSFAGSVSNMNVVVGARMTSLGMYSAFIWDNGVVVDIDPTPYGATSAECDAVSDTGFVVGQIGADSNGTGRAFRWKDGELQILPPLPGITTSRASDVNSAGVAAGECRIGASGSAISYHPTVWGLDGVPVELPLPANYASAVATRINDSGAILGIAIKPQQAGLPNFAAMVWLGGTPYILHSLINGPNPSTAWTAYDMNQLGQVLRTGNVPPAGSGGAWIVSPTGSPNDLNGDCIVDGADLGILLNSWGPVPVNGVAPDLNHDGKVDGADLGLLLGEWLDNR